MGIKIPCQKRSEIRGARRGKIGIKKTKKQYKQKIFRSVYFSENESCDYFHFTKHKSISQEGLVDPKRAAIPKIRALR